MASDLYNGNFSPTGADNFRLSEDSLTQHPPNHNHYFNEKVIGNSANKNVVKVCDILSIRIFTRNILSFYVSIIAGFL